MNAYLDQIERLNPRVNAIVSIEPRERLLDQAKNRDAQIARGEYLGWMHGFPHAVKDLEPTRGIRTTKGSPLLKNFFPRDDSIMVERIRQRRRDHYRQDQRAGVWPGLANLQSGLWHYAQRVRSIEDMRRQQWRRGRRDSRSGCCRWRTAAIMADRCEIRPRSTMCSDSELLQAACRRSSTKFSYLRFRCMGRWREQCRTSRCFSR